MHAATSRKTVRGDWRAFVRPGVDSSMPIAVREMENKMGPMGMLGAIGGFAALIWVGIVGYYESDLPKIGILAVVSLGLIALDRRVQRSAVAPPKELDS